MTTLPDQTAAHPEMSDERVDTVAEPPTHVLIAAPARPGKSVSMHGDISHRLKQGGAVYILDPHGVYWKGTP